MNSATVPQYRRLLANSRFWILALAVTLSVNIAGLVQYTVPAGILQTIRIEQYYGFTALLLLYIAIAISPLYKVFPKLPAKDVVVHTRRAIGVSAFYFALLHVCVAFFKQLGGFGGVSYLNQTYMVSLILGAISLAVLFILAATSFDVVVRRMGYKQWKLLHRLVYIGSIAVLIHIILIGPHYDNGLGVIGGITYAATFLLLCLETVRIIKNYGRTSKAAR